jgi:hypothetical protein
VLKSTFDSCVQPYTFETNKKTLNDVYFLHILAKRELQEELSLLWLGRQLRLRCLQAHWCAFGKGEGEDGGGGVMGGCWLCACGDGEEGTGAGQIPSAILKWGTGVEWDSGGALHVSSFVEKWQIGVNQIRKNRQNESWTRSKILFHLSC